MIVIGWPIKECMLRQWYIQRKGLHRPVSDGPGHCDLPADSVCGEPVHLGGDIVYEWVCKVHLIQPVNKQIPTY